MKPKVLLIHNATDFVSGIERELEKEGYEVMIACHRTEGLEQARSQDLNMLLVDFSPLELSDLSLISQLKAINPYLPIVLLLDVFNADIAIEAARLGVVEYLKKPIEVQELLGAINNAAVCDHRSCRCSASTERQGSGPSMIGASKAMKTLYKEIGLAASVSATVLIQGETGTGKELAARAIHNHSQRAQKSFIAINCVAIPETLLESELFGHERGAFTGAHARQLGLFEKANGGTLFLDEIGDLSMSTQAKLLRVLQEKCFQRLGGQGSIDVDVRILAATHRDLHSAIKTNNFREDLFYRLSVFTVCLPALRERSDDIPELAHHFIRRCTGSTAADIEVAAVEFLQQQDWPGNVRQLENVITSAVVFAQNQTVKVNHVKAAYAKMQRDTTLSDRTIASYLNELLTKAKGEQIQDAHATMVVEMERELFARAIRLANGNQAVMSGWLGVTRTTSREKLRKFGLHRSRVIRGSLYR